MLLAISLLFSVEYVDCRGKKKRGSSANAASCASRGLDCSATCCLDSTCAIDLADCAGYTNREYMEIYIGFGTLVALVIGIPIMISCLNFCLMYKFCQTVNEEDDTKDGGFTICEIIPRFMCCCFFNRNNRTNQDDDDDLEAESSQNYNLKAESTEKTQHSDNHRHGKVKSASGKLSPSGSNDDIKATNRSSQDDDEYHKSDNHSKKAGKQKKIYKNKCVKCLCIVFCCVDSNINEDDKGQEDGQVLLNKNEEIDFDPRRSNTPSKQGTQRILADKLNQSSSKREIESINEEEEENGSQSNTQFLAYNFLKQIVQANKEFNNTIENIIETVFTGVSMHQIMHVYTPQLNTMQYFSSMMPQIPQTHMNIILYNQGLQQQQNGANQLGQCDMNPLSNNAQNIQAIDTNTKKKKKKEVQPRADGKQHIPTSYMIFFNEHRQLYSSKFPNLKVNDLAKMIGEQWRSLRDDQKQIYRNISHYMRDNPIPGVCTSKIDGILQYKRAMGINVDASTYEIQLINNGEDAVLQQVGDKAEEKPKLNENDINPDCYSQNSNHLVLQESSFGNAINPEDQIDLAQDKKQSEQSTGSSGSIMDENNNQEKDQNKTIFNNPVNDDFLLKYNQQLMMEE
ncbi:UNKNOWN [Stylonychia lemnae]|uniref:HMG box domain-containing protein n=1 Tax=Stylonychia lemnae TaxID=5949 RepID=A0A078B9W4_STYLE|nr:UNKNOWN [Stylonychia lemnae]|eukprot:CDW91001.1 UNKNOWN [Stylonychia lemnae]